MPRGLYWLLGLQKAICLPIVLYVLSQQQNCSGKRYFSLNFNKVYGLHFTVLFSDELNFLADKKERRMIGRPPERHLFPFVGAYMEPRPSDECLLRGDGFYLISSSHGIGPSTVPVSIHQQPSVARTHRQI